VTYSLIERVSVDHPVHHDYFVVVVRGGAAKYGQLVLVMILPSILTSASW